MVLSFLIVLPIGIQLVEGQYSGPSIIVEFLQIVEDPTFESPPNFAINGSSDEFSTSYQNSTGGEDYNRAILNWTHTANNPLDFRPPPEPDFPDCNDFVYQYQNLTWDYEVEPQDLWVKVEFRMNFTGDFSPSVGREMAKIHVWFIDSSGSWCMIDSFMVFHSDLDEEWISVDSNEMGVIFQGMVENSEGVQEDPSDDFIICVGVAPSDSFREYSVTEPWRTYNGSVILELSKLEVHVAADVVETITDKLPTIANQAWVSPHNETVSYFDMASDGTIYGITTTSNTDKGISQLSLVKWDPLTNIVWNVTWNESRYVVARGISIVEDYIYSTGYEISEDGKEDMIITKWDTHGDLVWKRVIDTGMNEQGWYIEVHQDGGYSVLGRRNVWGEVGTEYYYDSFLLDFDDAGNLNWNNTLTWPSDSARIHVHPDGTLYTIEFPSEGVYKWTPEGSPELVDDGKDLNDLAFSPTGEVYFFRSDNSCIWIDMINRTGLLEELYRYNYSDSLPEPWSETIDTDAITISNDSIYLIVEHEGLNFYYELFKFDLEGNKIWNKTILDLNWRGFNSSISALYMEFGSNGLLYIGGTILTTDGGEDIGLAILNPEDVPVPTLTPTAGTGGLLDNPLTFAILIVGGIGAVIVVVSFKKVRR
ncbi:MAG: hypothetical protein ACXAAN_01365 [Candidatus Thorarchaeota archaeon]|jgi:hypothetical protein